MGRSTRSVSIQNYLPHREPMLMVDIISEIGSKTVSTTFLIKEDNLFVTKGELQEVALIENAAQTCAAIVGQSFFFDENDNERENVSVLGFISSIKKVKIDKLPKVGEMIITKGSLVSKIDGEDTVICVMQVSTLLGEDEIMSAELNLFLQKQ
ncbi:ABC transporter permease [Myroides odoratimimus]|uniref:ABC transporter permease n=1 Tax=Myroides odoratimimus TaxID=76832 RepID=UPI002578E69D|nr:ABC transporter permease [Myroides odoratimimus]MDM1509341.1 ABC transporter permease [Myroides odoratimimus]MDM1525948.1 ABC transporter permease [Myroides odoratimimus]MDM1679228.1 ABC transporter permease [Myroides odoratimimus]MEC4034922.1 ABC transporter permease [Myroides odoratimimus]MEC4052206.1 ABC transporter permease [Myroides odoratimimus]